MTMLSPCMLTATGPGIFKTLKNTQSVDFITHGLIFRDYMVLLRPVYSHHHPWAYFPRLYGAPQTCILPSSPMGLFSEIIWCSSDLYTPTPLTFSSSLTSYPRHVGAELKITVHMIGLNVRAHGPGLLSLIS